MKLPKEVFFNWFDKNTHYSSDCKNKIWNDWNTSVNDIFKSGIHRQPEFFIQCAFESQNFKRTEENLHYTTPDRILKVFRKYVKTLNNAKKLVKNPVALAECVYGSRMGNNSEGAKDLYKKGWSPFDFRGQGYIQLTGYDNWKLFNDMTGVNCFESRTYFIDNPWLASGFFWTYHKLDYVPGVQEQTKIINGGYSGLQARKILFKNLLKLY